MITYQLKVVKRKNAVISFVCMVIHNIIGPMKSMRPVDGQTKTDNSSDIHIEWIGPQMRNGQVSVSWKEALGKFAKRATVMAALAAPVAGCVFEQKTITKPDGTVEKTTTVAPAATTFCWSPNPDVCNGPVYPYPYVYGAPYYYGPLIRWKDHTFNIR
jgi:hypothetical protein